MINTLRLQHPRAKHLSSMLKVHLESMCNASGCCSHQCHTFSYLVPIVLWFWFCKPGTKNIRTDRPGSITARSYMNGRKSSRDPWTLCSDSITRETGIEHPTVRSYPSHNRGGSEGDAPMWCGGRGSGHVMAHAVVIELPHTGRIDDSCCLALDHSLSCASACSSYHITHVSK
jgi:hypothetical protein